MAPVLLEKEKRSATEVRRKGASDSVQATGFNPSSWLLEKRQKFLSLENITSDV